MAETDVSWGIGTGADSREEAASIRRPWDDPSRKRARGVQRSRKENRQTALGGIDTRAELRRTQLGEHKDKAEGRERDIAEAAARNYAMNANPYSSSNMLGSTQSALDAERAANRERTANLAITQGMEMGIAEGDISDAKEREAIATEAALGAKELAKSKNRVDLDMQDEHGIIYDDERAMLTLVEMEYDRLIGLGLETEAEELMFYYTTPGQTGYRKIYQE